MQCSSFLSMLAIASFFVFVSGLSEKGYHYSKRFEDINHKAKRSETSDYHETRSAYAVANNGVENSTSSLNTGLRQNMQYFVQSTPNRLYLLIGLVRPVAVNYSLHCDNPNDSFMVRVMSLKEDLLAVVGRSLFFISCNRTTNNSVNADKASGKHESAEFIKGTIVIIIKGKLLGVAPLYIEARRTTGNDVVLDTTLLAFIMRKLRTIDKIFRFIVPIFFFVLFIGFGCKLDLEVVKECMKKPIAPGIGLGCQYILMPLLGYGIASLIPIQDKSIRLGIFLCGICPGGGVSNIYTYLLGGDVSLSITMTFISTLASIGFIPLWVYTLGQTLMDETISLTIPFIPLLKTIALTTVPVLVGVFIKWKFQRVAKIIIKILKPVTIVFLIVFIIIGIISSWYIFTLLKPLYVLSGCLLPYLGYLLGGIIAAILRQPWTRVKAIAIEAGMQNVGIAFILLLISFPPPLGDVASVAPAANSMMTPIPVLVISIPYMIYRRYKKKYEAVETLEKEDLEKEKPKDKEKDAAVEKLSAV